VNEEKTMKCFVVLFALLALSQSASLNSLESVEDVIMADNDNVELEEGALNAEEEARVYKGYNGGNRVWYG